MKTLFLKFISVSLMLVFYATLMTSAQNTFPAAGSVGIGTASPNAAAILDVTSTTQGVLIPRMTTQQRNSIASPPTGLLIFQTNGTSGLYYYNGTAWSAVSRGANRNLDNLTGPTAINADLLPDGTLTRNLGSTSNRWNQLNVGTINYANGTTQSTAFIPYNSGTGITITGTTIAAQNTSALWNANQLQGRGVTTTAPSSGEVLKYNGTNWAPSTDNGASYSAGTGISISGTTISAQNTTALWNANQLQGRTVTSTAPTTGQVMKYDGTNWAPSTDNNTTYSAGTGISLSGTTFSAQNTTALWNANQLQGRTVTSAAPSSGQVLKYDGTNWAPATDNGTTYSAGTGISISGTTISNASPSQWTTSGSNIYYNTGNVGVGTTAPAARVDVQGGHIALNDNQLRLRIGSDANEILAYDGTIVGPRLAGFAGGVLGGTSPTGDVLHWIWNGSTVFAEVPRIKKQ